MNAIEERHGTNNSGSLRKRLVDEVEQARNALTRLAGEYDRSVTDTDVIQEDRDAARQMVDHARATMAQATEALARHDAGSYGMCTACGQPIDKDRLDALPRAATCWTCSE